MAENPPSRARSIQQTLDIDGLAVLTAEEADIADEEGLLAGNQHYQDLQTCDLDDLRFALKLERGLVERFRNAKDPAAEEVAFDGEREADDERAALWHLDVGVASAVLALVLLGGHTVLSCNGGEFGRVHTFSTPQIRAYLAAASADQLLDLARRAGVGVGQEGGLIVLYAHSCNAFMEFAAYAQAEFPV